MLDGLAFGEKFRIAVSICFNRRKSLNRRKILLRTELLTIEHFPDSPFVLETELSSDSLIGGRVTDHEGLPLPYVGIISKRRSDGARQKTTSGPDGRFLMAANKAASMDIYFGRDMTSVANVSPGLDQTFTIDLSHRRKLRVFSGSRPLKNFVIAPTRKHFGDLYEPVLPHFPDGRSWMSYDFERLQMFIAWRDRGTLKEARLEDPGTMGTLDVRSLDAQTYSWVVAVVPEQLKRSVILQHDDPVSDRNMVAILRPESGPTKLLLPRGLYHAKIREVHFGSSLPDVHILASFDVHIRTDNQRLVIQDYLR